MSSGYPSSPPEELSAAQKRARFRGSVVAFLGVQVLIGITLVAWFTVPMMFAPDAHGGAALFTGSKLDRWLVLFIYANVAMIGLTITAAGLLLANRGQRPPRIVLRLIGLFAALASLAVLGLGL